MPVMTGEKPLQRRAGGMSILSFCSADPYFTGSVIVSIYGGMTKSSVSPSKALKVGLIGDCPPEDNRDRWVFSGVFSHSVSIGPITATCSGPPNGMNCDVSYSFFPSDWEASLSLGGGIQATYETVK